MSRILKRQQKKAGGKGKSPGSLRAQLQPEVEQALNHLIQGRLNEAQTKCREILAIDPHHPDAHHILGIISYHRGEWLEAVQWLSQTIRLKPDFVDAHNNLGLAHQALEHWQEAIQCYQKALSLNPRLAQSHNNLGNVLGKLGQLDAAMVAFQKALSLDPRYVEAMNNLANIYLEQGDREKAVAYYRQAIALAPAFAEAHRNLGNVLKQQGLFAEACQSYQNFLRFRPDDADVCAALDEALLHLGLLKADQRRHDEAARCFQAILTRNPHHAEALAHQGISLQELNRLEEAVACLQTAITLKPDAHANHNNLGMALQKMGRHEQALSTLKRALELQPDNPGTMSLLGFVHQELGQVALALEWYERAIAIDSTFAEAHFGKGMAQLLTGHWSEGWANYEWRWKKWDFKPHGRTEPQWHGENLQGSTILLHCEQGYGDSIQFIRLAPLVQARGARVVVLCPEPLHRLFQSAPGIDLLTCRPEEVPPCTWQIPLLSLPVPLQLQVDTLPATIPYLHVTPDLPAILPVDESSALNVGLVWRGNPDHKNDRNRSLSLSRLAPLLEVPGCVFYSFQRDIQAEEKAVLSKYNHCVDASGQLPHFAATAALLERMDLVISVDTALIHLAGALGRPVWGLLPYVPDWRWMLERTDSPWYPSLRLFRQTSPGNWPEVIERVRAGLMERVAAKLG
ncbi:MAG: tetratricopeptide repeat protein [Magnetococcales bacterium]|nr:tetratricopeptide repeat protein [Magnetococcales bacterium]